MIEPILDLFFPPCCLHCESDELLDGKILCTPCSEEISWCDPTYRCRGCFVEGEELMCGFCEQCKRYSGPTHGVGAALDHLGPANALRASLLLKPTRRMVSAIASLMVAQLLRLEWPLPDRIVAIQRCCARRWINGPGPSVQLGQEVAKQLDLPFSTPLTECAGRIPQRALSIQQRLELKASAFTLDRRAKGKDEILLLIEDLLVTGGTVRAAARALQALTPSRIYALALCR